MSHCQTCLTNTMFIQLIEIRVDLGKCFHVVFWVYWHLIALCSTHDDEVLYLLYVILYYTFLETDSHNSMKAKQLKVAMNEQ